MALIIENCIFVNLFYFRHFQTSLDTVVWCNIHPLDHTIIVTYGKQHVYFWKLRWDYKREAAGKLLRDTKSGIFDVSIFVGIVWFDNRSIDYTDRSICHGSL